MAVKKLSSFVAVTSIDKDNDLVPISKYLSPGVYETRNAPADLIGFSGNYSDLTGTPTLGTAAALNVGTSANNIVQLDGSARLPAVDGSLLTNVQAGITSPLTTKGDLWYHNGTVDTRLAKGVKGQVLTQGYGVNATGLEWRYSAGYGVEIFSSNTSLNAASAGKFHEVTTLSGDITVNLDSIDTYVPYYFYNKGTNQVIFTAIGSFINGIDKITIPYGFAKVLKVSGGYLVDTSFTGDYNDLTNKPTSLSSPLTTKGDLWSYSTTNTRLGVGTNGQVLKANSATATGLQWGAIAYSEITGVPTLGTAAALNVGTSANNVIQLDGSAKLPAVDGSQLTNLPVGGVPYQTFKANQTSNYTIQQSDHGTWIPCATNNLTITLPNGLLTGTQVILDRRGTATVTVTASTTLIGKNVSANSVQIANQYGVVHCVHTGSNIWRITGDL